MQTRLTMRSIRRKNAQRRNAKLVGGSSFWLRQRLRTAGEGNPWDRQDERGQPHAGWATAVAGSQEDGCSHAMGVPRTRTDLCVLLLEGRHPRGGSGGGQGAASAAARARALWLPRPRVVLASPLRGAAEVLISKEAGTRTSQSVMDGRRLFLTS